MNAGSGAIDEDVPAALAFAVRPGRMLAGHTRASWPLDLPEMPWIANTFVNLGLERFDGERLAGAVDLYAAPGLDPRRCSVEVVWGRRAGVALRGAPAIERIDDRVGTRATWRFRARVDGAPVAVKATAYVFCPNDTMFYSIESVAGGPAIRDAYCKELRRDPKRSAGPGGLAGARTYELAFACGVLVRQNGRALVDACRKDTLVSLDALGAGPTAVAPAEGTDVTDEELRRWFSGATECARIHLVGAPTFPATAEQPYAELVKRAGARLLDAFSRDGMIQP